LRMVMLCLYQVFAVMFEDLGDIGFHAVNFMVDSILEPVRSIA
jgi:hypothetical protein